MRLFFNNIVQQLDRIDISDKHLVTVYDGDSLTRGFNNAGIEQYYPLEVNALLEGKALSKEFYSYGVGGQSTLNMLSDASSQIYTKAVSGKECMLFAWEDVNAILNDGRTAQQNFDDFVTYFNGAETAGFQYRILITGYYPRKLLDGTYHNAGWTQARLDAQHDYFELVKNADINSVPWTHHIDLRNNISVGGSRDQFITDRFADSVHLEAIGYDEGPVAEVWGLLNQIFLIAA